MDQLVRAHEAACLLSTPPSDANPDPDPEAALPPRRLPAAALSQAAKSALSLELDCGELAGRVLTALRSERWRARVSAALCGRSKRTGAPHSGHPLTSNYSRTPLYYRWRARTALALGVRFKRTGA